MTTINSTPPPVVPNASLFEEFDINFSEGEQAEKPITQEARLWWFNGLSTDTDTMAIGWHIRAGINPYLDECLRSMGVQQYLVHHASPDKDGVSDKPYWRLRSCSLIILMQSLLSPLEMNRTPEKRQGLAWAWAPMRDEQGQPTLNTRGEEKRGTVLKLRVYIHELYLHGFVDWMPLTLSGFSTDPLLEALADQYRVLDYYGDLRRGQGKNPVAPFYLFSLPLGPGAFKAAKQGKIYPIVSQIPATLTREYLRDHIIPADLIDTIRSGLLAETIAWSIDESVTLARGRSRQGTLPVLPAGAGLSDERVSPTAPTSISTPLHSSPPPIEAFRTQAPQDDPFVQQPQLTWITQQYCQGDLERLLALCTRFDVVAPEHLRMSHFRILVGDMQGKRR